MFMSAALTTADNACDPALSDGERGRLVGLVRKLIDCGRELIATLKNVNGPNPPLEIARRFGGVSLALIITRITRGLMIAAALEKRLLHPRPRVPTQTDRKRPESPKASRTPRQPPPDEEEELLGTLPSAREIAARIRNRRIGAVLVEICRDLGITTRHELWRELNDAIIIHGGNTVKLMHAWWRRHEGIVDLPILPEDQARFEQVMAAFAQPP